MNEQDELRRGSLPRIGVLGCGYWGINLVRNFSELGTLAAVADASHPVAARAADAYGVDVLPWEEICQSSDFDAVAIATPASTHAAIAERALRAGKHVFVEKPLALRVADGEAVVKAAEESGRTLMVGHLLRYHPAFVALESLVRSHALGRIRYIYSNRLNFGKFRRVEDILWSFSPHDLSMILSLIGSEPHQVRAIAASYLQRDVADTTTTHLSFPGGEAAHVFVSWLHPYKEQRLVVVGENAMAVFDDGQPWEAKLQIFEHRVGWNDGIPEAFRADGQAFHVAPDEPLALECRHFVDCILTGKTPITDGAEALRVLRVLEAADRSMKEGSRRAEPHGERDLAATPATGDHEVHETAVVDPGARIGSHTKVWHFSHIQAGAVVGRNCTLGQNVSVGPGVAIGDGCKIQNNVSLFAGVVLEDAVFCGPSCVFTNVLNPRAEIERKSEFRETIVRRGASIGANATIVCGNEIGAYALVGAGAVVTKDVPAHAIVAGTPARHIGWVSRHGERLGADLCCPVTGEQYRETERGLEVDSE